MDFSTNLTGKELVAIAQYQSKFVQFLRSEAYCNLNDLAKISGKRVDNWMRLKTTKELFEFFRQDPSYNGAEPIIIKRGREKGSVLGTSDLSEPNLSEPTLGGGTWAHPDIAIQFAQWCSPGFALWVSRQIRHLLEYGEVNLHHKEWTQEQYQRGVEFNRQDIKDLYGK